MNVSSPSNCHHKTTHPNAFPEQLITNASTIKRFFERWRGDGVFRDKLKANPQQTAEEYNLDINPQAIRMLWDREYRQQNRKPDPVIENFQQFVEIFEPAQIRQELLHQAKDIRFRAWRKRQMARLESLLKPKISLVERSYPLSIELSQGCSVGCSFCGVSAPRLEDLFLYTEENRQLWRDVLQLLKEVMGDLAGASFCYHATEPLDNPDYEKFCLDFHDILGVFPQTTTAQALKNLERTQKFLKLSEAKGQLHNRFSILSLKMLSEVHRQFTPRELAFTGLELRHKEMEAEQPKVNAGRARTQNRDFTEPATDISSGSITTTIGFLLNMVQRTVQLITPCIANERWKNGYRIHETRQFTDAAELKVVLEEIINYHMPLTLRATEIVKFRPELKFKALENGFQLSTLYKTYNFTHGAYAKALGSLVAQGNLTYSEITQQLNDTGVPLEAASKAVNFLHDNGILDDEVNFR